MTHDCNKLSCRRTRLLAIVAAAAAIVLACSPPTQSRTRKLQYSIDANAYYESNIYHSYDTIDKTGAMLNNIAAEVYWKSRVNRKFSHRLYGYADLDLYPGYTNRNKSQIGIKYAPFYRYARHRRLGFAVDLSRRNKDLIDDTGQILARTLTKWVFDFEANHKMEFGNFELEQVFSYGIDNYDEQDTVITTGTTTNVVHLTSYDYDAIKGRLRAAYAMSDRVQTKLTYDIEHRNYDERKTYTVQGGAFVGQPSEIRSFTEHTIELATEYAFSEKVAAGIEVQYVSRKDNFENFYGFKHWQYRASLDMEPAERHVAAISFRFKNKDYDNYWNSRIGRNNRVAIDYADLQMEYGYRLTPTMIVKGFVRNYNKVSNDLFFDYHDFTGGLGFAFEY